MQIILKNQMLIIKKRLLNFLSIFFLLLISVFLINSSLTMYVKVNNYTTRLAPSNQVKNTFLGLWEKEFSNEGLAKIKTYFFNSSYNFSELEINQMLNANKINVLQHHIEIEDWNYDFRGWLLAQEWLHTFKSLSDLKIKRIYLLYDYISSQGQTHRVKMEGEFFDREWSLQKGISKPKPPRSTTHDFILEAGRLPEQDNEVLVTSWKCEGLRLQIGDKFTFKEQEYVVVGTGFTYFKYLYHESNKENRPATIWFHNLKLHDYWVAQQHTGDNGRYIDYFVYGNNTKQWAKFFPSLLAYFNGDLSLYLDGKDIITQKFNIIILQTMLFFITGLFIFVINVFIIKNFVKKELMRQQTSLGLLLALGYRKTSLIFAILTAYLPILLLAIWIGFAGSFGFQHFLLFVMNQVIYIPMEYLTVSWWLSVLLLLIFPSVLVIIMLGFLQRWLVGSPITLIQNNMFIKNNNMMLKQRSSSIYHNFNFKIMLSFAHRNWKKIISAVFCFFITTSTMFSLLNILHNYQYSQHFLASVYTDKGNRYYVDYNATFPEMLKSFQQNINFTDQKVNQFHWVSDKDFKAEIKKPASKFQELTFADFATTDSLFNKYLSPTTVEFLTIHLEIVKRESPKLADLLTKGLQYWKKEHLFPYFTFGFKIFNQANSVTAIKQQAMLETTLPHVAHDINIVAYQKEDFIDWIKYQNAFEVNSIKEIDEVNSNYLNAILPLQMARNLKVKYGDIIKVRLRTANLGNEPWLTIPIRVIGANVYNYASIDIIIKAKPFLSYVLDHYNAVNKKAKFEIQTSESFDNLMLVNDPLPEVNYNVSFQSENYQGFNELRVATDLYHFLSRNYQMFNSNNDEVTRITTALLFSLLILSIIVFISFCITLLVILNIIVSENSRAISGLKILGYFNREIVLIIILPYLIGFIISMLVISSITYFLVQLLFEMLFNLSGALFLVNFSYGLLFSFIFGCSGLIIISLFVTYSFISRQSFGKLMVE